MANWAKLQEDTLGLPVFKRAKHGIHFDKGNGEILANFSGKPAHFQDTDGLWKPIDTKLLPLGDGYFGCPHSKVKVHPNGTVAVAGTDYVQYTQLPSGQTGLVDNDKLVRKFAFGEQRMWVTEDGFKSEIQLNRIPTLKEARKLIASESGTLSKEYLKSLTTATDANGDSHTFSTLTAFRTWLASASFPVVIDPDFTVGNTMYGDFALTSGGNATKNYGAFNSVTPYTNELAPIFRFDLTTIPSDSVCTAVALKLTRLNSNPNTRTHVIYSVASANSDWIEGTKSGSLAGAGEPCWNARKADGAGGVTDAWAGSAGMSTSGTDYENTILMQQDISSANEQYSQVSFNFNAAGIARAEGWFGTPNTNYGFIFRPISFSDFTIALSEYATESYRPVLTVTYTAGGGITPIVQYYNQLRRNK